MRMLVKLVFLVALVAGYSWLSGQLELRSRPHEIATSLHQLDGGFAVSQELLESHACRNQLHMAGWIGIGVIAMTIFSTELTDLFTSLRKGIHFLQNSRRRLGGAALVLVALTMTGCWRPFEPVQLETINPNDEVFLLPLTGEVSSQTSTNNEEYLRSNLVYTKQVKLPQQWVQHGFETFGPNGSWKPAAILVKVDKSPVTREWTADPNSGTSNKNEAIWVMTADQVEFSTGWTCTARIASRDDAVKFLDNYPNGSLQIVMDTEVRGKLQATFGLEVTDQPMTKLRQEATPHILCTTKEVINFFKDRGVTITNLGITGGFIYKDKSIMDTMVRVFNAEQEKAIATAGFQAQEEQNKAVFAEAEGRAKALLTTKRAEADGIKLVADAKVYEIDMAKTD